mgnify:CR=1 FL=1
MTTLVPSCRETNSSSSIASSGEYIGMIAAGMIRSLYGPELLGGEHVIGAAEARRSLSGGSR